MKRRKASKNSPPSWSQGDSDKDTVPAQLSPPPSTSGGGGGRPTYLLSFSEASSEAVVGYVIKKLEGQGLQCHLHSADGKTRYVTVTAKLEILAKQAEIKKWTKQLKGSEELMDFSVQEMDEFKVSSQGGRLFESSEEILLLHHVIEDTPYETEVLGELKYKVHGQQRGFIAVLLDSEPPILEEEYPLHECNEISQLSSMLRKSLVPFRGIDVDKIRNYFGEDMAFYFAWMNFYSTSILFPAVVGVVMYLTRGAGTTVDTDPYLPFYSVFMAIWAVLFLVFWQRRSSVHSYQWNTHSHCSTDEYHHKYHGVSSLDPVTGEPTIYYPAWKRRLWYFFSFLAMLPLLLGGMVVMTLSLNLNGYVQDKRSLIYVSWLAQYAEPGRVFAADSPYYLWLVPTLAHSITINFVNQIYSGIARKCTDLENHRTFREWHSALVVKRVCFECVDCFMPLFYIAFYQLDVVTLRAEIVSLFMSDEIRRVVMECVIPMVTASCAKKKLDVFNHGDVFLSQYDQFDDYLEMVIQFGYITFFASAFSLGGLVTMVFIYMELRSDIFKLLHAYRRPLPLKCKHIGVWYEVMRMMVFMAILTNCAILGFSSEQLMQWIPSLFTRETSGGDQIMAVGSGRYVVGFVFGFEHLLLLMAVVLQFSINPVPKWVRVAIDRRKYLAKKRMTSHMHHHHH